MSIGLALEVGGSFNRSSSSVSGSGVSSSSPASQAGTGRGHCSSDRVPLGSGFSLYDLFSDFCL